MFTIRVEEYERRMTKKYTYKTDEVGLFRLGLFGQ